ncbi:MAG: response regulator [Hormoscilla sp.]
MLRNTYKVLLIEDDPEDRDRVLNLLAKAQPSDFVKNVSFQLTCADRLSTGIEQLATADFDVVLLTLGLPDSSGVDTLVQIKKHAPSLPIVLLTGEKDETIIVQALQLGAHGYLAKDQVDSKLLVYAIRLAHGQQQQLQMLESNQNNQLQEQQEQEMLLLDQLASSPKTNITAKLFGLTPLREGVPEIFNEIVQQYGDLMELALEQHVYKVEHNISDKLRGLAEQLGFLKAAPRDVVEIHTTTLKQKTQDATPVKAKAYVAEGRLMVLELMGDLASYYRKYFIGLNKINIANNYQKLSQKEPNKNEQ